MGEVDDRDQGAQALAPNTILIDRYQITGILNRGKRAVVYQARDLDVPDATHMVAVKGILFPPEDPEVQSPQVPTFLREANILAVLNHVAMPHIFAVCEHNNANYLVMQYIDGSDLDRLLDETTDLPMNMIVKWGIALCDVLGYLHDQEPEPIIHCNVTPENIMIDRLGEVVLVGWGAARILRAGSTYGVSGTDGYMAPEQYDGDISPKTDIFALGATLHHLVTRTDPRQLPLFSFYERPVEYYNAEVPPGLGHIINKALAMDPTDRYGDIQGMRNALSGVKRTA